MNFYTDMDARVLYRPTRFAAALCKRNWAVNEPRKFIVSVNSTKSLWKEMEEEAFMDRFSTKNALLL